ncbi:MAG: hypothetical protein CMF59_04830 [Leptospiraceae bacterium]|nr:hypothetical protein [Leptospiraceae bacterium]
MPGHANSNLLQIHGWVFEFNQFEGRPVGRCIARSMGWLSEKDNFQYARIAAAALRNANKDMVIYFSNAPGVPLRQ